MAAVPSSSSEDETDPPLTSTSKHVTDTESISCSPRSSIIVLTNRNAPLSPRGSHRLQALPVDTARKVDEALAQWSGEDPSVSNPFPGITLHQKESTEDILQRALESWAGSDWQRKEAIVANQVKKKHLSGSPKAFPGIDLHDETVQDLAELPGAKSSKGEPKKAKTVPRGLTFPGVPIHDESEDLNELPGTKHPRKSTSPGPSQSDAVPEATSSKPKSTSKRSSASAAEPAALSPSSSLNRSTSPKMPANSTDLHRSTSPKSSRSRAQRSSSPKEPKPSRSISPKSKERGTKTKSP